jgi:hypothetical protein
VWRCTVLGSYEGEWLGGFEHGMGVLRRVETAAPTSPRTDGAAAGAATATASISPEPSHTVNSAPDAVKGLGFEYRGSLYGGVMHGSGIWSNKDGERYEGVSQDAGIDVAAALRFGSSMVLTHRPGLAPCRRL